MLVLGNKIDMHGASPLSLTCALNYFSTRITPRHSNTRSISLELCHLSLTASLPAGSAHEDELKAALGLGGQTTGKGKVPRSELSGRPIEIFMCSVKRRSGYGDGECLLPCHALCDPCPPLAAHTRWFTQASAGSRTTCERCAIRRKRDDKFAQCDRSPHARTHLPYHQPARNAVSSTSHATFTLSTKFVGARHWTRSLDHCKCCSLLCGFQARFVPKRVASTVLAHSIGHVYCVEITEEGRLGERGPRQGLEERRRAC